MWPFKRKLKSYMLDSQYRVVDAFSLNGVTYQMFDDTFKLPAGRGLWTLTYYEEFNQRCTREYLQTHVRAMEIILSDPKKININALAIINRNLKERLELAVPAEHIYRLASVVFFDKNESPFFYDFEYNKKKIAKWKAAGGTLDFFMRTPLRDLIPSLKLPNDNAETYFRISEQIDELHRKDLQEVLSRTE